MVTSIHDDDEYCGSFSSKANAEKFQKSNTHYFLVADKIDICFSNYKKERNVCLEEQIEETTRLMNENRFLCNAVIGKYKNEKEVFELSIIFNSIIERSIEESYGFHSSRLYNMI